MDPKFFLSSFSRPFYEGVRPRNWKKASKICKQKKPYCSVCGSKKELEAHDILPYRLVENPKRKSIGFWLSNMVTLCRHCHFNIAHCGSGGWWRFNTKIITISDIVTMFKKYYCRK